MNVSYPGTQGGIKVDIATPDIRTNSSLAALHWYPECLLPINRSPLSIYFLGACRRKAPCHADRRQGVSLTGRAAAELAELTLTGLLRSILVLACSRVYDMNINFSLSWDKRDRHGFLCRRSSAFRANTAALKIKFHQAFFSFFLKKMVNSIKITTMHFLFNCREFVYVCACMWVYVCVCAQVSVCVQYVCAYMCVQYMCECMCVQDVCVRVFVYSACMCVWMGPGCVPPPPH